MYANKCYFHPHAEGQHSCRGCRLPVCMGCAAEAGYCPECATKKRQVQEIQALRQAAAKTVMLQTAEGASVSAPLPPAAARPGAPAVARAPRSASGRLLPAAATAASLDRRGGDRRTSAQGAPQGVERRTARTGADRRAAQPASIAQTAAATRRLHTQDSFQGYNPRGTAYRAGGEARYRAAGVPARAASAAPSASAAVPFALGIGATLLAIVAVLMVSSAWKAQNQRFENPFMPHSKAGAHQQF